MGGMDVWALAGKMRSPALKYLLCDVHVMCHGVCVRRACVSGRSVVVVTGGVRGLFSWQHLKQVHSRLFLLNVLTETRTANVSFLKSWLSVLRSSNSYRKS